jgi:dihydrofolate synthase/folylpolyglutamate synthase
VARIKPGLARVQLANEMLGWAAQRTPSILVAGTNGKGTTSSFLWRLLAQGGLRCGLFTSPHLISFAERIQVSDRIVRESDLVCAIHALRARLGDAVWDQLSFFEVSLLLGFDVWADAGTELNVLEVGLGGRLDATNIASPGCSVITSIGIDHAEYLGNSIRQIAFEKSGIIRAGRPVFTGFCPDTPDNIVALEVIQSAACQAGSPLWRLGVHFGHRNGRFFCAIPSMASWEANLPRYFEGAAPYLVDNFCTAAAVAAWCLHRRSGVRPLSSASLVDFDSGPGPWAPSVCGRFHQLVDGGGRTFLLDVCHNPHGAARFVEALDQSFGPDVRLPGVVSILRDKDVGGVLDILTRKLHPIVLFKISNDRSLEAGMLPARYSSLPLAEDFESACAMTGQSALPTVVCGSVMAVGDVIGRLIEDKVTKDRLEALGSCHDASIPVRQVAQAAALLRCLSMRDVTGALSSGPSGS